MIFFSHHKHIPIRLYFTSSIILESSYSLYDRAFADNIGTVLFYAVIVSLCSFIFVLLFFFFLDILDRKGFEWIKENIQSSHFLYSCVLGSLPDITSWPSFHVANSVQCIMCLYFEERERESGSQ
jgi:hypothetical protein